MRLILTMFSLACLLSAQSVEIVADKFFADERESITEFTGNVVVTKDEDRLVADRVVITFDKNRQPLKYRAFGGVKIDLIMEDRVYFGSAQTMIYNPLEDQYTLIGDAFLHEKVTNKKVHGDRIFIDQIAGHYKVESNGKEPVKFIFKVDEKR